MKESDIQRTIIDTLLYDGWLVIRLNGGGATYGEDDSRRYVNFGHWQAIGFERSTSGYPDLIAVCGEHCLLIEVKRLAGKLSPDQKKFKDAARQAGATYIVATGIEDLRSWLRRAEVAP